MKKILVVFGTRPEAIKMCPLVKQLKKETEFQTIVCVTGQHKEMLEQVLSIFEIVPDYNLQIMKQNQTLFDITNKVMDGIKDVIEKEKPSIVLVHGDTSTTFATALSSFYLGIPVGHIEAGLRTYNNQSPYPEEFNRQAVGSISALHFAPTKLAAQNLFKEGKKENCVYITGNTVIDALQTTIYSGYENEILKWASDSKMILLTAHRRENLGIPLVNIFKAVKRVVDEHEDIKVIYPIHKNPKVRVVAEEILGESDRIKMIEPLDVLDFHNFMNKSYMILTDSGGIQEEAPALGKPVLVLRDTTERPEGVEAGTLKLVGTEYRVIYEEFKKLLQNKEEYELMSNSINPYGDGTASIKITQIIKNYLQ